MLSCRARAIEIRQQNQEAVGGFFSQIGSLYTVHHLWGKQFSISSVPFEVYSSIYPHNQESTLEMQIFEAGLFRCGW